MKLLIFTLLTALPLLGAPSDSLVRINSTLQSYKASQPWEKNSPKKRRGLGTLLSGNRVLTTAAMAADAIYLELESADSSRRVPAKLSAIDYKTNLALLVPINGADFLKDLEPAEVSSPVKIGDDLEFYQLEDNGDSLSTSGTIRKMDLLSTFVSSGGYLSYQVKASMQTAGNSFTLPAYHNNKLAGVLTSYNSKDQICDVISADIISAFLKDAADGKYLGFPSLGAGFSTTEDEHFRAWLKLPKEAGGIYINRVLPGGSGDSAGMKKGDVILTIDGNAINRQGYYQHEKYGTLYWPHLVGGSRVIGEEVSIGILREGRPLDLKITLKRAPDPLLPLHRYGNAPPYLIKGGLVFQELSRPYLLAFGKEWASRGPLNLLDVMANPSDYEEGRNRVVVLTRVVPTEATIGYDRISNQIIEKVNGKPVADLPSLAKALSSTTENGIHEIETDQTPYKLYLDQGLSDQVDIQFKARGLPSLSRLYEPKVK